MNYDPRWDPAVRARIHRTLDRLIANCRTILDSCTSAEGIFEAPPDVEEFGDVTGILQVGTHQLVNRLQAEVDQAREDLDRVDDELHAFKRQLYGPGYKPTRTRRGR